MSGERHSTTPSLTRRATNSNFLLLGYVILENHLHLIARSPQLSDGIQRFKSFTARRIIDLLRDAGARALLDQLQRLKRDHKTDSKHQFWQEGSKP